MADLIKIITSSDNPKTGYGTKVLTESGVDLSGIIRGIEIRIFPDEVVTANVEIDCIDISEIGYIEPRYLVMGKVVKKIEFEDGSAFPERASRNSVRLENYLALLKAGTTGRA